MLAILLSTHRCLRFLSFFSLDKVYRSVFKSTDCHLYLLSPHSWIYYCYCYCYYCYYYYYYYYYYLGDCIVQSYFSMWFFPVTTTSLLGFSTFYFHPKKVTILCSSIFMTVALKLLSRVKYLRQMLVTCVNG